ncbi:hypothetical protein [Sphaerisporangium aureirubrum]|uniref:Uncharacterized protein n=1 Tax=Sphaerisporangium aureirubrum TaxID=1544736 RepID=A0ABW1NEI3_9ACTN
MTSLRVIKTAADLQLGDILTIGGRDVVVDGLVPETREAAIDYGSREVRSGSWWDTFPANQPVTAAPGSHHEQPACVMGDV